MDNIFFGIVFVQKHDNDNDDDDTKKEKRNKFQKKYRSKISLRDLHFRCVAVLVTFFKQKNVFNFL